MNFFPIIISSEIIATVKEIISHRLTDFDKPPHKEIVLICNSANLPLNFEVNLKLSVTWTKMNLKKGDAIKFSAKIKKTEYFIHRTERFVDNRGTLPADMLDSEEEIKLISIKQIMRT